jgi:hypothetical protein
MSLFQRQKIKTILQPLSQMSTPDSGYPTSTLDTTIPRVNDDLPIAQCKGIRSCTQHSISNFVSYNNLSLPNHTFLSKLSSVSIHQSLQGSNTRRDESPA